MSIFINEADVLLAPGMLGSAWDGVRAEVAWEPEWRESRLREWKSTFWR